jgi:hypothetical protein
LEDAVINEPQKRERSKFYEDNANITLFLPKNLKRSFKALMRERNLTISEALRNFITATLDGVNK